MNSGITNITTQDSQARRNKAWSAWSHLPAGNGLKDSQESQAEVALRLRVAMENVRWLWKLGMLEAHVAFRIMNDLEAVEK